MDGVAQNGVMGGRGVGDIKGGMGKKQRDAGGKVRIARERSRKTSSTTFFTSTCTMGLHAVVDTHGSRFNTGIFLVLA